MSVDGVEVELIAATCPNTFEARSGFNELVKLHADGTIELLDAAVMVREFSGKLSISERAELTPAKGAGVEH